MVSAADGGVATFGDDVTLTIPAGALDMDTEIGIKALGESDWPVELSGLTGFSVADDYLRLSPGGLAFNEPAVLSRRLSNLVDVSVGEVTVRPSVALRHSDGSWELLPQTVAIDDNGAVVDTPIGHFSDNVLVFRSAGSLVEIKLSPADVQRLVGHHFLARLSVEPKLGTISTAFWRTFFTVDSGPLVLGIPSDYRAISTAPKSEDSSASSAAAGVEEVIAPFLTPMPVNFPAGYNCAAAGKAVFGATFQMSVRLVADMMEAIIDGLSSSTESYGEKDSLPDGVDVNGTIKGKADCVENPDDLTPGLVDVTSSVASDPANHSCCVKQPPRKARMTLGSLWFADAKLGDSTD